MAEQVKIKRVHLPTHTMGVLTTPQGNIYATVERPWKDNIVNVSCIPKGTYLCKNNHDSPKFGKTISVKNVVGRTDILMHVGNFVEDSLGCILVNSYFNRNFEGSQSKVALDKLMAELPETFELVIE